MAELALRSLRQIGGSFVLEIGHMGFAAGWLESLGFSPEQAEAAFSALSRRSAPALDTLAERAGTPGAADGLRRLAELSGPFPETLERARAMACSREMWAALAELDELYRLLSGAPDAERLRLDLSVGGVMDYYNGIVFNGYTGGVPAAVLSGGRYDGLMRRMGKPLPAVGFAVYLGEVERAMRAAEPEDAADWLTVALPKGRLGERVYNLFAAIGCECPAVLENTRALVFENPEKRVRYLLVKPADVTVYVERGAADLGVCGSDVLAEGGADVYELLDLKTGVCRMAVAARNGFREDPALPLRVATKYPAIASAYFERKSRRADIIELHGSIELAPLLGLSDVIVDIVETGSTLRENDLAVVEEIMPVSARLIANRAAYKFKSRRIGALTEKLGENL